MEVKQIKAFLREDGLVQMELFALNDKGQLIIGLGRPVSPATARAGITALVDDMRTTQTHVEAVDPSAQGAE